MALPGTVQAERFDEGGPGVAYVDTTAGNGGGQYRTTDVDVQSTTDTGGGYNVGRTRPGEWLKYSVTVASAGTYALDVRVANIGTGARFQVEIDGIDRTGPMSVPNTGGWQTWQTVTKTGLSLTAGAHVIRLVFETGTAENGGVGNYNWLRLRTASSSSTPYRRHASGAPRHGAGGEFRRGRAWCRIRRHDRRQQRGRIGRPTWTSTSTTDAGGGYNVGRTRPGEWLKYSVTVASAGTYALDLRIANVGTGARFHVEIDGVDRTGPISVPNTGGWQTWQTVTRTGLSLTAGSHVIRLVFDTGTAENGGVGNYNWVRFVAS